MKKRIMSVLILLVLFIVLPTSALAATPSLYNFKAVNTYYSGRFKDVPSSKWYAPYVQVAYEYGLINGKTAKTFSPETNLTIAEAIKLAVCLDSIYYKGAAYVSSTTLWYRGYVDYALDRGIIIDEYPDYDAYATRAQFAQILAGALPYTALEPINDIYDGDIPDVYYSDTFYEDVYTLYRAGILTGSDGEGSFDPFSYITRAEVAAVVTRMANPEYRMYFSLWMPAMYPDYDPVIDFGAYFGVNEYATNLQADFAVFCYLMEDIPYDLDSIHDLYAEALCTYVGFEYYDFLYDAKGFLCYRYYNSEYDCAAVISDTYYNGEYCYQVDIYYY